MNVPHITDPRRFGRVAVLCGGWSSEREVSLQSGHNVYTALKARGVDATLIDADRQTLLALGGQGYVRALNLMHGTGGEDGTVQAVLDLHGIAYPGSGVLGSALAMDKLRSKRIWRAAGLPTADFMELRGPDDARAAAAAYGYPLFIKPAADGSSVGVTKVKTADALAAAFETARGAGRTVMAEAYLSGAEYTCAVLGDEALPLIRIEPDGEFYDYHAKYISEATRYHCPAELDAAQTAACQAMCLRAFELVGGRGWGRVDFIMDGSGAPQLVEVNTLPGMTSHSLVPMAAKAVGLDFEALCWRLLELSLAEAAP